VTGDYGAEGETYQKDPGQIKDTELKEKTFLTENEAAEFCNVGKTIFRRAVSLGFIPYCIFPGSTKKLFHRETIEKAVKGNRKPGLARDW